MNERLRSVIELLLPDQRPWMERVGQLDRDDLMQDAQRTQVLRAKFGRVAMTVGAVGLVGMFLGALDRSLIAVTGIAVVVSVVSQYIDSNLGVRERYLNERVRLVSASAGGFTPGAV